MSLNIAVVPRSAELAPPAALADNEDVENPVPNWARLLSGLAAVVLLALATAPARAEPQEAGRRLIKSFDFDERGLGNLGSLPMLWRRHRAPGFPEYARGGFDTQRGANAPPSFYLELDGRSCAYHYTGYDIVVQPGNEYRITARVRPDGLVHARAFISAYFRDADGRILEDSQRRSELLGDADAEDWSDVGLQLPRVPPTAHFMGLALWVVQETSWRTNVPAHHIAKTDVNGGAAFDDIAIYRLPIVQLSSSAALRGHVFGEDEEPTLQLRCGSGSEDSVLARLSVRAADGRVVHDTRITGSTDHGQGRITLPDLDPGLYHARLEVKQLGTELTERHLNFVKLSGRARGGAPTRHRLGLIVGAQSSAQWPMVGRLLERLGCRQVKIAMPALDSGGTVAEIAALGEFLEQQVNRGSDVVAVLRTRGGALSDGARGDSLVDLIARETESWAPQLKHVVARYHDDVRHWQIGADWDADIMGDERLGETLVRLRSTMAEMTTAPRLVLPWSIHQPIEPGLGPDVLALDIPADVLPQAIPDYVDSQFGQGPAAVRLWLSLRAQVPPRYRRLAALSDFAKRVIFALQSRAERIYVAQPWHTEMVHAELDTQADERFAVYRTLLSWLDDGVYLGPLSMKGSITCHVFDRDGEALLVMWDDVAPAEGRDYELQLSGATHVTDLWGRTRAMPAAGLRRRLRLSSTPLLVHSAETWLVQFRQGLRFEPQLLPSESTVHEIAVLVHNPRREPISGSVKLRAPQGWRMRPAVLTFAVQPGDTMRQAVLMQSGPREPAGQKHIDAEVEVDASRLHRFHTRLPLRLDLVDMRVWAELLLEGDDLIVRHGVTNLSNEHVTFRSMADAPGRKRQNLNVIGLGPGQTAVKVHLFEQARALSGETLRLGLKQIKGPRVHDLSIQVP